MKFGSQLIKLSLLGALLTLAACSGTLNPFSGSSSQGGYAQGERAYAEREAARLNRQQSLRLRAGSIFR